MPFKSDLTEDSISTKAYPIAGYAYELLTDLTELSGKGMKESLPELTEQSGKGLKVSQNSQNLTGRVRCCKDLVGYG